MCHPIPFSAIFYFHGTPPSWADEMAQIIGRLDGTDVTVDIVGETPQNPSLGVVHYAANIEEILQWIQAPATAPAILIATHLFGPDVMVRFKSYSLNPAVAPRDVLAMGQCKSYTAGNKESLDAKTLCEALESLSPDHWFKKTVRQLVSSLSSAHQEACGSHHLNVRNSLTPSKNATSSALWPAIHCPPTWG